MDSYTLYYYRSFISPYTLVFERHQIEKSQNHIENIVDYDAVFTSSAPLWKSVVNKKLLMHYVMLVD